MDASLTDLRALAALLTTTRKDASRGSGTSLSIEWGLPLRGDALSPGTATTCATASLDLSMRLTEAAVRAQLLSTLVTASIAAYELAETTSAARFQVAIASYSLTAALAKIFISPITGKPAPPDTAGIIVGDVVSIIDAALPGSYEQNVAGIGKGAVTVMGRPDPVSTSLVGGPGSAAAPPAARSVGEAMGRIDDLYRDDADRAHIQVQRIVDPATGQGHWVAMLPGTSTFAWNAKTPLDGTGNLAAAAGRVSGGEVAVSQALRDAMKREGALGKGEPVMLVGHSQGGMVMTNLARRGMDGINVTHVTTYGSPVGAAKLPNGVRALNIEDKADIVHRIDGRATGDADAGRVRLVIDDPTSTVTAAGTTNVIQAHSYENYRWNYEAVMAQERTRPGPPSAAVHFENSVAPFFQGQAHTYRYDATRRPDVQAAREAVDVSTTCVPEPRHEPLTRRFGQGPTYGHGPADQYRVTSP